MGSYQIWPCHMTQAKNLSFPYLKSYCSLNFRKSHQISWFCCIPNGSYKEDNLKEGRICPPPPMWNRVKHSTECYAIWSWPRLSTLPNVSQFPDYFAFSRFENEATTQCFAFSKQYRSFQIISHFKNLKTGFVFCIFQIVSQFPDYFAFFKKFLNYARILQIPVSRKDMYIILMKRKSRNVKLVDSFLRTFLDTLYCFKVWIMLAIEDLYIYIYMYISQR